MLIRGKRAKKLNYIVIKAIINGFMYVKISINLSLNLVIAFVVCFLKVYKNT